MIIEKDEPEMTTLEILAIDPKDLEKIKDGVPQYAIDRLARYFYRLMQESPEILNEAAES